MGQKVHPVGFRLGVNKTWASKWYKSKDMYGDMRKMTEKLTKFLNIVEIRCRRENSIDP